jgi:hypothetical protein
VRRKAVAYKAAPLSEAAIQGQVRSYLAALGIDAIHAANGSVLAGDAKARAIQSNALKKAGVLPGFPDLILFDRKVRRVGFMELKSAKGKLTPSQEKFEQEFVPMWGWPYAVVRSVDEAQMAISEWGWR